MRGFLWETHTFNSVSIFSTQGHWALDAGRKGKFANSLYGEVHQIISSDWVWPQLLILFVLCLIIIFFHVFEMILFWSGLCLLLLCKHSKINSQLSSQQSTCVSSAWVRQDKCAKCELTMSDEFWGDEGDEGARRGPVFWREVTLGHVVS